MKHALAVYSSKTILKGAKFAALAKERGVELRFLALGGIIPANPDSILKQSLAISHGGALLVAGAFEEEAKVIKQLDESVAKGNQSGMAKLLNAYKPGWCELYTEKYSYEKTVKMFPKAKAGIDGSVSKADLPKLKAAKARYIVFNQSKSKPGTRLMKELVQVIADATEGVVADYKQPAR